MRQKSSEGNHKTKYAQKCGNRSELEAAHDRSSIEDEMVMDFCLHRVKLIYIMLIWGIRIWIIASHNCDSNRNENKK